MVATVGGAREERGARGVLTAALALAVGLVASSAATFGLLGLLADFLPRFSGAGKVAVAVCAVVVVGDALGLRVRPQIRVQVPERWRRQMPLPLASLLYGLLLGTGFSSAVPAFASWGLVALVVLGTVPHAALVGVALGLGRALPVLLVAPLADHPIGTRAMQLLTERPFSLRLVRFAGACILALAASQSPALAGAAIPGSATNPSVVGGDVAWERPGTGGFLLRGGVIQQLPGHDPALGGALVAWHDGADVTVADAATLGPRFSEPIVGVRQLAVSDAWLVLRQAQPDGMLRLIAQSVVDTSVHRVIAEVRPPSVLGRPSVSGSTVVYSVASRKGSWIAAVDLEAGTTRRIRRSAASILSNPTVLGGALLYVETARCAQRLVLGPLHGVGGRVLLSTPPLAGADLGHERGHTPQGEHLPCPSRVRSTKTMLWTTALDDTTAYVTAVTQTGNGTPRAAIRRVAR
jgi:cytochrome c biogenesis protein CcdA